MLRGWEEGEGYGPVAAACGVAGLGGRLRVRDMGDGGCKREADFAGTKNLYSNVAERMQAGFALPAAFVNCSLGWDSFLGRLEPEACSSAPNITFLAASKMSSSIGVPAAAAAASILCKACSMST